jgi:hypothetical protein
VQALPAAQSESTVQLVRHPLASQVYGAHETGLAAPHAPPPLQATAGVKVEPVHEAAWQVTSLPTNPLHARASLPSQERPRQGSAVPETHAIRLPRDAPTTAVQVPEVPTPLQASHCPVHARLQHTPSTQLPEPHSAPAAQPVPGSLAQEPSLPVVAHELPASQLAAPQQTWSVQKVPEGHPDASVHGEPSTGPEPETVQVPAWQTNPVGHAVRPPCTGPVTAEQSPSFPTTLQALHVSPQMASQQTPSTHWPLVHSWARAHAAPLALLGAHAPDVQ